MEDINRHNILVRDILPDDFNKYVDYWYSEEVARLEQYGLVRSNLIPRGHILASLNLGYRKDGGVKSVKVIEVDGQAIGAFSATDITEHSLVLHCSIWSDVHRGKGIGTAAYRIAILSYFETYDIEVIEFFTPKNNHSAIKVKSKLGMKPQCETYYPVYLCDVPVPAFHYIVSRSEAKALFSFAL